MRIVVHEVHAELPPNDQLFKIRFFCLYRLSVGLTHFQGDVQW